MKTFQESVKTSAAIGLHGNIFINYSLGETMSKHSQRIATAFAQGEKDGKEGRPMDRGQRPFVNVYRAGWYTGNNPKARLEHLK